MRNDGTESLRRAVAWVTEAPIEKSRHDRAMAFLYATLGLTAFPGCNGITGVCEQCKVSPRTMRYNLRSLRVGFGIYPPSRIELEEPAAFAASENADEADDEDFV